MPGFLWLPSGIAEIRKQLQSASFPRSLESSRRVFIMRCAYMFGMTLMWKKAPWMQ